MPAPEVSRTRSEARRQAETLLEQARLFADRRRRSVAARQALRLSPDCLEAYLFLAQGCRSPFNALAFYRQAVEAGERVLGPTILRSEVGYLWQRRETHLYLRARASLAQTLWDCGQPDHALRHWYELLRLDGSDHLHVRYLLAAGLLELGRSQELEALLRHYTADAASAYFTWVTALALFRRSGPSAEARHALDAALASNAQVPAYLLGRQPLPRHRPRAMGHGDASEAIAVAAINLKAWRVTPGALDWLASHIQAWFM